MLAAATPSGAGDHGDRRRAGRRVQPDAAVEGARRARPARTASSWPTSSGTRRRASRCSPAPPSSGSTAAAAAGAQLADGGTLPYDVLVLATGSCPVLPPVAGLHGRDGSCCRARWRSARWGTATAITAGSPERRERGRGRRRACWAWKRHAVWPAAACRYAGAARPAADGTPARRRRVAGTRPHRPRARRARTPGRRGARGGRRDSRVRGVVLDDGGHCDADLLVLCCGVRPRVELAREAGLAVERGHRGGRPAAQRHRPGGLRHRRVRRAPRPDARAGRHRAWAQARVGRQVIAGPGGTRSSYAGLE